MFNNVPEIPLKCICSKPLCNGTPHQNLHLLAFGVSIGFGLNWKRLGKTWNTSHWILDCYDDGDGVVGDDDDDDDGLDEGRRVV